MLRDESDYSRHRSRAVHAIGIGCSRVDVGARRGHVDDRFDALRQRQLTAIARRALI
jgi:hypothetical protein